MDDYVLVNESLQMHLLSAAKGYKITHLFDGNTAVVF